MNDQLHQDILDIGVDPAQFLKNAEVISRWSRKRDEKISKELEDACVHWGKHLREADRNSERLVKKFEKFINKHLLHWIETLSWINKLGSADLSLQDGIAFLVTSLIIIGLYSKLKCCIAVNSNFVKHLETSL